MYKMKKTIITLSLLLVSLFTLAQSRFEAFSDVKGVKYMFLNKATISAFLNDDVDIDIDEEDETILNLKEARKNDGMKSFLGKLDGIYIASSKNKKGSKKLAKTAKPILSHFSSVMNFGDSDNKVAIYSGLENDSKVTIIYVQEKTEANLISIVGQAGLDDIVRMVMGAGGM